MGDSRGAHWVLVDRLEGRKPLGRPMCRREDNIKMDLQAVRWGGGTYWIDMAQDRARWVALANAVMQPSGSVKYGEFLD
jgi:hypothetical protein